MWAISFIKTIIFTICKTIYMRVFTLLAFAALFFFTKMNAQTTGQNEAGLDWKIIKTDKVDVIFTPEMRARANRVADIINHMATNNTGSIGDKSGRKIQLVLRNKTVVPNGYVGLAPHRSEFFATPPEDLNLIGSNNWLDALTVHEYRHVQQNYNARRGIASFYYYLFGEQGWGAINFLTIPSWYYEGDAVIAETTLTDAGRGRTPNFTATQRAMALENKNYSYAKWRNGSFDELVPDRYRLGYMMLTHMRNEKGSSISAEVLASGAKVYTPYPFSVAMKRKTGYSTGQLFDAAWDKFSNTWKRDQKNLVFTKTKKVSKDDNTPTFYNYPQYDSAGNIISLKTSYKETPNIVSISRNREDKIKDIGISNVDYFHYGGRKITWTEITQNLRRNNTNFSDIMIYDCDTKKTKQITKDGKYFSPALSLDGSKIVATNIKNGIQTSIQILDSNSGNVEWTYPLEETTFAFNPSFTQDGDQIVYIKQKDSQLSLVKINLASKTETTLTPYSAHVISSPRVYKESVYFSAAYSQIDNIYRVPLSGSQEITQITSVPVAAYHPAISPDGTQLLMTEVISSGQKITRLKLSKSINNKITIVEPIDQQWMDEVSTEFEGGQILNNDINKIEYDTSDYSGILRGMRLHSWGILPTFPAPSLILNWNNVLDDLSVSAIGGYNLNEKKEFYEANLRIARYYPIFDFRVKNQGRSTYYLNSNNNTINTQEFRETSFGGDISVPLATIDGNFFKNINIGVGADYRIATNRKITNSELDDKTVTTAKAFLSYYKIRRKAIQNIRTKSGLAIDLQYFRDLNDSADEKFTANAAVYFPGLITNHSFKLSGRFQRELLTNSFVQSDVFQYTRGYNAPFNDQVYVTSADYALPLLYPDIGIAGIIYFKRIKANFFYDYGNIASEAFNIGSTMSSAGSEIILDHTYLNLIDFSLGFRYSYRFDDLGSQKKGGDFSIFIFSDF